MDAYLNGSQDQVTSLAAFDLVIPGHSTIPPLELPIPQWRTRSAAVQPSPLMTANHIVVSSTNGAISGYSRRSGQLQWTHMLGPHDGHAALWDNTVFVSANRFLHAICAETSHVVWSAQTSTGFAPPVATGGVVYCASLDGTLFAIEPATGDLYWQYDLAAPVSTAPVVAEKLVIIRTTDGDLHAFDTITGELQWSRYAGWIFDNATMAVSNQILVATAAGPMVKGLHIATGEDAWSASIPSCSGSALSTSANLVLITSTLPQRSTMVTALHSITGAEEWRYTIEAGATSLPQTFGASVLIADRESLIHCLDLTTGMLRWKFQAEVGVAATSFAVHGNAMILGTGPKHMFVDRLPKAIAMTPRTKGRSTFGRN